MWQGRRPEAECHQDVGVVVLVIVTAVPAKVMEVSLNVTVAKPVLNDGVNELGPVASAGTCPSV